MEVDIMVSYLLGAIIGLVILYFLTRFVFSVDKRLKQNAAQIKILSKMAEKLGVDSDELNSIRKEMEV